MNSANPKCVQANTDLNCLQTQHRATCLPNNGIGMRAQASRCFATCLHSVIASYHEQVCSHTLGKPADGFGDIAAFDGRDNAPRRKTEIAFGEFSGHEFLELRLKAARIRRRNMDYGELRREISRQLRGGKECL